MAGVNACQAGRGQGSITASVTWMMAFEAGTLRVSMTAVLEPPTVTCPVLASTLTSRVLPSRRVGDPAAATAQKSTLAPSPTPHSSTTS